MTDASIRPALARFRREPDTAARNARPWGRHRKDERDKTGKDYLEREFSYGQFLRSVTLPDGVEGEKLTAELKDGVLEITAPISAAALPRKIAIKTASKAQAAGG